LFVGGGVDTLTSLPYNRRAGKPVVKGGGNRVMQIKIIVEKHTEPDETNNTGVAVTGGE
jgi:hypothetical protein